MADKIKGICLSLLYSLSLFPMLCAMCMQKWVCAVRFKYAHCGCVLCDSNIPIVGVYCVIQVRPLWVCATGMGVYCVIQVHPLWVGATGMGVYCVIQVRPLWVCATGMGVYCVIQVRPLWVCATGMGVYCVIQVRPLWMCGNCCPVP